MNDHEIQDLEPGFIFQRVARQRLRLTDKRLVPYHLTSAQVFMLNWLLHRDGMTQKELAQRLSIGTVAVSGMVDRLEAANLVYRGEDPTDRRAKKVWLKESARTNKELLSGIAKEINDVSFQGLSKDEIKKLLSLMERVRRNLAEALDADDASQWLNTRPIGGKDSDIAI
ncbi:MarR family transcriptional regulator [Pseudooceanicola sp.]|uniref:MarR family winged helix-turn-helix transcriptional regulator n=1 Tax=Pseudooceanicola sp. TaxID=1914328 RepID=UPI00260FD240|nr:MarR family transcriptional regulator [Pseudooceanicola sp.]MDF1856819.1 MarR family transcriptional regulator [Pseudooceanicola sp.]